MASNLSYASTPMTENYIYEALPERLSHLATEDGDKEAFVYYDRNWQRIAISRKEIFEKSMSMAKVLFDRNISHRGTSVFCMSNSMNMLVASMATICAGGIPFYMATSLKDGSDIINAIVSSNAEILFIDTNMDDDNWQILENVWPVAMEKSNNAPSLKTIICNGHITEYDHKRMSLSSLMVAKPKTDVVLPIVQPEDTLMYFGTSGSTGAPKEVMCSHFQIFNMTMQIDRVAGITKDSRYFSDRTFSWQVGYPRTYLSEGCTRIFVDQHLSLSGHNFDKMADIIAKEKCDVLYLPGYTAVDLLNNVKMANKFKNVNTIIMAGERIPKTFVDMKDKFCRRFMVLYGTTETGGVASFINDQTEKYEDGIVGKPLPGVEMKIIDDSGLVVSRGVSGELCVRTAWRFSGYHDNDAMFSSVVDKSSWFHTGDLGHIREDGNIVVDGRRKEIISTHGKKCFPWPIEQSLKKMEGIQHAFAVGVPDKRLNEVVCACVVPKEDIKLTTEDVKKYCDDVFLEEASAMVLTTKPHYHVVLETIPLTRSGKTDRRKIASIAREHLGL